MMNVTKEDLINYVIEKTKMPKEHVRVLVNCVLDSIVAALQRGEKVELRGFGSFRIKERKARKAYNPKLGRYIQVKAKKIPFFRPGKALREKLNSKD